MQDKNILSREGLVSLSPEDAQTVQIWWPVTSIGITILQDNISPQSGHQEHRMQIVRCYLSVNTYTL